MKKNALKISISFFLFLYQIAVYSQAASCIHSGGIHFLSDAYLGALGACDCVRTGVFLTSFAKCNSDPYELEFEDNFDGDSIDLLKWQLSPSTQGNYKGGQSLELRTLNNVSVSNGTCHIVAKKETVVSRLINYKPDAEILQDGKQNLRTFEYTSSLLVTRKDFFHGKYEIRCRMPEGKGLWPAFWTFGGKRYNEIDIFDSYSGTKELINCIYHDYDGDGKPSGCNASFKNFDLSQWHTYSCIFETDQITFLVDDRPVNNIYRVMSSAKEPIVCNDNIGNGTFFQLESYPLEPMKIIFNLAVTSKKGPGGSFPVDNTTPFPSSFDVDYIKFWKRTENTFYVYPNPSHEKITIKSSNSAITELKICNLQGLKLYDAEVNTSDVVLDVSGLSEGVYLIEIFYEGGSQRKKIVKFNLR
ncbi:hypothetical protein CNR22_10040 [Sphingobacteriaceae bacterium]|nr:hypothetical protein CNR22_10040 [Sphingobacteriaceae bacterium]